MQKYKSNITSTTGAAIRNVPVTVLTEAGELASLFLDRAGSIAAPNPLATDSSGNFYFYAINGRYSLRTTVEGVTITDDDAVLLQDPAEITVAGPIAEAVAAAQTAAQQAQDAVENSDIPNLVASAQNAVIDSGKALQEARLASQASADAKQAAEEASAAAELAKSGALEASSAAGLAAEQAGAAALTAQQHAESIDPDAIYQAISQKVDASPGSGLISDEERSKLAGVAEGATANSADAALVDRKNHTGSQKVSTIEGLEAVAVDEVLAAVAMAQTFTAVPTTFQAACIVVTQPHLRFMYWSSAQNKYVRAPWHPVGQVVYSYGATLSGALPIRADLSYNQSDYPDLAAYIGLSGTGTFSLIEARGEFLRVLDNGRGKDVGRVIRSWQADATREHTHGVNYNGIDNSNGYGGFRLTANVEGSSANTLGISGGGGTETRPSNIALPLWLTY